MSFELNRRTFVHLSAGSFALIAANGLTSPVSAQDASPEASAETTPVISVTQGPGEDEFTVIHAQGETVIKKNPQKIISFDVAAIESIEALGGSLTGVPELATSNAYFSSDADYVGTLAEPDYEAVNALAPDLIIVAGRSAAAYGDLSKIAPTIDVSFANSMMDSFRQITSVLGAIIGNEDGANSAIVEIEDRVSALKDSSAASGSAMVIMVSAGSVTALAPYNARGGRGALIYDVLGLLPPVDDLETATHGEPISFEFLLEHNPDWMFVIDRDNATGEDGQPAAAVLDNDIIHETTAYQNDQIVYVDPFDWYIITGASIPSFQRMLGEIEVAFGL